MMSNKSSGRKPKTFKGPNFTNFLVYSPFYMSIVLILGCLWSVDFCSLLWSFHISVLVLTYASEVSTCSTMHILVPRLTDRKHKTPLTLHKGKKGNMLALWIRCTYPYGVGNSNKRDPLELAVNLDQQKFKEAECSSGYHPFPRPSFVVPRYAGKEESIRIDVDNKKSLP